MGRKKNHGQKDAKRLSKTKDNTGACEVLFSHPSQKNDEKTALASPPLHIQIFLVMMVEYAAP